MGTIPKLVPGRTKPVAVVVVAVETGEALSAAMKLGLNRPLTKRTSDSVILYAVFWDDMLRFRVAVVGVKSCCWEMLRLIKILRGRILLGDIGCSIHVEYIHKIDLADIRGLSFH